MMVKQRQLVAGAEAKEAGKRANLIRCGSFNFSKAASSGIHPPERLHHLSLPKQCHQLGTKYSNIQNNERYLSQNTSSFSQKPCPHFNLQVFLQPAICLSQCVFVVPCDIHSRHTIIFQDANLTKLYPKSFSNF